MGLLGHLIDRDRQSRASDVTLTSQNDEMRDLDESSQIAQKQSGMD